MATSVMGCHRCCVLGTRPREGVMYSLGLFPPGAGPCGSLEQGKSASIKVQCFAVTLIPPWWCRSTEPAALCTRALFTYLKTFKARNRRKELSFPTVLSMEPFPPICWKRTQQKTFWELLGKRGWELWETPRGFQRVLVLLVKPPVLEQSALRQAEAISAIPFLDWYR